MRYLIFAACTAASSALAENQSADALSEIRAHAIATNDREKIAEFMLEDYAAAVGYLKTCDDQRISGLTALSREFAAWSRPGIMAWITGDRREQEGTLYRSLHLSHSVAAYKATVSGACDDATILLKKAEAERLKIEIKRMFLTPL
ncbi:hypothetical protein [Roseovarius pacificus]